MSTSWARPSGTSSTTPWRPCPTAAGLALSVTPEPKGLRLALRDTGIGIAPEDLPYVFDPFFSSKPDGTGMGLTKVYQVISDHRGEIQIKSVPGQGTEVSIWLPRWLVK